MKNINSRALSLAHEIKPAYSSFRLALITAYKALKSTKDCKAIMLGMVRVQRALCKLGKANKTLLAKVGILSNALVKMP